MDKVEEKVRELPQKPEWQIILDHLVYQDQITLYRICRRMIIFLNRLKAPEIYELIEKLNPTLTNSKSNGNFEANWPKPKGSPFNPNDMIDNIFKIADKYLPDRKITSLLNDWLHQDHVGKMSLILERRHSPLIEAKETIKKYLKISYDQGLQPIEERIGLRVSLIYRFLSENMKYISIAKNHITIAVMDQVLDRTIGPAFGNGKLGGKSAGLILARQILKNKKIDNKLLKNVKTPKSRFLTSDELFEFMHYNALEEFVYTKYQIQDDIKKEHNFLEYIFKNSPFSTEALNAFNIILDQMEGKPIIVRSSSLLEDSFEGAFSGKYKSLFISNIGSKEERLTSFMDAITEVYASIFAPDPIEYRRERNLLEFREEMGILIQEVVGTKIGKYFLPSYAGVAFSKNELSWSPRISRDDGVIRIVAGLGTRAVDRTMDDYPTLISPGQPGVKVNQTVDDIMRYSQKMLDVINLETNSFESVPFEDIIKESDGYFPGLENIVSFIKEGELIEPISSFDDFASSELLITFNNLIDRKDFVATMKEMLSVLSQAYEGPVDIEFASDGKSIYLLQCRPQSQFLRELKVKVPPNIPEEKKVFSANYKVTNGFVKDIEFVVYVDPINYSNLKKEELMKETGRIVGCLNRELPKKGFILMGPGRWGSKGDIKLGVPVNYSDINNSAMLIEIARSKGSYMPELSFGTHFFQDLVEANIKYLPLYPDNPSNIFKDKFFNNSRNFIKDFVDIDNDLLKVIKVIKVSEFMKGCSLDVYMDGETNYAVAVLC